MIATNFFEGGLHTGKAFGRNGGFFDHPDPNDLVGCAGDFRATALPATSPRNFHSRIALFVIDPPPQIQLLLQKFARALWVNGDAPSDFRQAEMFLVGETEAGGVRRAFLAHPPLVGPENSAALSVGIVLRSGGYSSRAQNSSLVAPGRTWCPGRGVQVLP